MVIFLLISPISPSPMFKYDQILHKIKFKHKISLNGVSDCVVGNTSSSGIKVTLYFLGYTARKKHYLFIQLW